MLFDMLLYLLGDCSAVENAGDLRLRRDHLYFRLWHIGFGLRLQHHLHYLFALLLKLLDYFEFSHFADGKLLLNQHVNICQRLMSISNPKLPCLHLLFGTLARLFRDVHLILHQTVKIFNHQFAYFIEGKMFHQVYCIVFAGFEQLLALQTPQLNDMVNISIRPESYNIEPMLGLTHFNDALSFTYIAHVFPDYFSVRWHFKLGRHA